jgi:AraC family transcriptional regulator
MRIEHRLLTPGTVRPVTCTWIAINVALQRRTPVRWLDRVAAQRAAIDGARSLLAAHLVSKYSNIGRSPATLRPSLPDQKLKRVIDLIESRFAEGVSLSELAAAACLSQFHFCRLFQSATGLSPHRYLIERRIQDAKTKLAEGRLSLVEIALETGFGSQASFNRTFRKHMGLTPGQFRTVRRS